MGIAIMKRGETGAAQEWMVMVAAETVGGKRNERALKLVDASDGRTLGMEIMIADVLIDGVRILQTPEIQRTQGVLHRKGGQTPQIGMQHWNLAAVIANGALAGVLKTRISERKDWKTRKKEMVGSIGIGHMRILAEQKMIVRLTPPLAIAGVPLPLLQGAKERCHLWVQLLPNMLRALVWGEAEVRVLRSVLLQAEDAPFQGVGWCLLCVLPLVLHLL